MPHPSCADRPPAPLRSSSLLAPSTPVLLPVPRSFKNSLCNLPVYRKPWEHVISATVTAYAFEWILEQEDNMVKKLEEHYAKLQKQ